MHEEKKNTTLTDTVCEYECVCVYLHTRARSLALRPSFRCRRRRRRRALLARVHRLNISQRHDDTPARTARDTIRQASDDDVDDDVKTTAENGTAKTRLLDARGVPHRPATCVLSRASGGAVRCDARTPARTHARVDRCAKITVVY